MLLKEVSETMKHIYLILIKLYRSVIMNTDRMCRVCCQGALTRIEQIYSAEVRFNQ